MLDQLGESAGSANALSEQVVGAGRINREAIKVLVSALRPDLVGDDPSYVPAAAQSTESELTKTAMIESAAAAILLMWVLNQAIGIAPRFLPLTALMTGWAMSLAITASTNLPADSQAWVAAVVLGLFAGLSAVGLYRTAEKTVGG